MDRRTNSTDVGNNGTFYYPKIDLLATAVYSENILDLSTTHPREKEKILFLRENPEHLAKEKSPFKESYINIHYQLKLAIEDPTEFHIHYEPLANTNKK
ncbi:MAG: hypothetical protein FGM61_03160 [Sediminibacterium sp.]|nr:hypothetical protein [Sediminibacterium sp.]